MSSWKEPNLKFCQNVYISVRWWSTILILSVYEWECLVDQLDAKIIFLYYSMKCVYCVRAPAIIGGKGGPVAGAQAADADAARAAEAVVLVVGDLEPEDFGRPVAQPQGCYSIDS